MTKRSFSVVVVASLVTLSGCDKLKGAIGKGGDAGTSSGGGILSPLTSDFEGEITSTLTNKGHQKGTVEQIVFDIKKPKFRIDTSGGAAGDPRSMSAGSFIIDPPAKKAFMLVHPQKMAMTIDLEKMKNMPKGQSSGLPGLPGAPKGAPTVPSSPPKIDKTGKKDVVAGFPCDIWNITSEGKKVEVCVADAITWVDVGDLGLSSPGLALAVIASDANRFPLRVIGFDAKGAEEMRMEATKIEKKKLDDTRFVVPPDYRVVDTGALMGGLGAFSSGFPGVPPSKTH